MNLEELEEREQAQEEQALEVKDKVTVWVPTHLVYACKPMLYALRLRMRG